MEGSRKTSCILVIDDEESDRTIMRRSLEAAGSPYEVEATGSVSDAFRELEQRAYSLVLLDYTLRETDGLSVLGRLGERFPDLPVVLVTGSGSEAVAAKAMKAGAYDYVVKDTNYASILPLVVRDSLERHRLKHENRQLREEFVRKERQAALHLLSAGIAHDIRNPLVTIRSFLSLLPSEKDDPEFMGEFREAALSEVQRIASLVDQLVAFARPSGSRREKLLVGEVLERAASFLGAEAERRGVPVRCQSAEGLSLVGDFQRLVQAVSEVVLNALQASPKGDAVRVEAREDEGVVAISVEDGGEGIREEDLPRVFDPFFTTREPDEGAGLGLTLVRAIVEDHGGRVGIESRPGDGTRVSIRLPGG
jgi:signal transduction histidine kinase